MVAIHSRSGVSSSLAGRVPALVRLSTHLLPSVLRQQALSGGLNTAFNQPVHRGELDFMRGRCVRIRVSDIDLDFSVTLLGQRLFVSMNPVDPDVTFRAELRDLLSVIAGQTDPDTLFFRRRLAIEGNTELGLALKNFLDSQDPEQLIPAPAYRLVTYLSA
ncbi:ubiquinone anaerobic biosynthesis accessory factor UbiT [Marinimicrobium sp. C2-29]|uniref:ubiquinone anaerobic biosynthesis accessory factor UbiT n=1 Tax=Marinimicrobium sp. C2-29 TaxID=3139825 RepID=UPI003138E9C1